MRFSDVLFNMPSYECTSYAFEIQTGEIGASAIQLVNVYSDILSYQCLYYRTYGVCVCVCVCVDIYLVVLYRKICSYCLVSKSSIIQFAFPGFYASIWESIFFMSLLHVVLFTFFSCLVDL